MHGILSLSQQRIIPSEGNNIELSGTIVQNNSKTPPFVVVNYTIIPGNKPVEFKNWAGFWRDNGGNFWESEPIAWAQAESETSRQILIPLERVDYGIYYVGYYTNARDKVLCGAPSATLSFPGVTVGKDPFSCSIVPLGYDGEVLSFKYQTPVGNNPKQNYNRVVLWEGDQVTWDCLWQRKMDIPLEMSVGSIKWPVSLDSGATYTLAYMNGDGCQNIAASCVFKLSS